MQRGFSLIELMVAVTIASILALVSVSSYKRYKTTADVGVVNPIVKDIVDRSTTYYDAHGTYPTVSQAGFTPTDIQFDDFIDLTNQGLPTYVKGISMVPYITPCGGAIGLFTVNMDGREIGLDFTEYNVTYYLAPINGVSKLVCFESNEDEEYNFGYAKCYDGTTTESDYRAYLDTNVCAS